MAEPAEYTILVVDDEPTIRIYLKMALSLEGYDVIVASDGADALIQASKQRIHVVFLDNDMPGLSGLDVLPILHRDYPDVAIIMASAEAGTGIATRAMQAGAFDCIRKPIDLDDLLEITARACESKTQS